MATNDTGTDLYQPQTPTPFLQSPFLYDTALYPNLMPSKHLAVSSLKTQWKLGQMISSQEQLKYNLRTNKKKLKNKKKDA